MLGYFILLSYIGAYIVKSIHQLHARLFYTLELHWSIHSKEYINSMLGYFILLSYIGAYIVKSSQQLHARLFYTLELHWSIHSKE